MHKLRIAQLSTSASGGAAIAAKRLNKELIERNIESKLIHSSQSSKKIIKDLTSKLVTGIQDVLTREPFGIATPLSLSKVEREQLIQNFDLLHVHNWYNLLSLQDLQFLGSRRPMVFTMHDERLLTGGCHTTLGCENFTRDCKGCPAVLAGESFISRSKNSLSEVLFQLPGFSVITPSRWMKDQWGFAYPSLAYLPQHIPNIIEHPVREGISFGPSSFLEIIFVSANLSNPVKGLSNLLAAIDKFDLNSKVKLNLVGKFDSESIPMRPNTKFHGELSSVKVFEVMRKSHLLVVPSLSENSPNVIAEAQLLGLPILASNVGGNSEIIEHGVTGFLARPDEVSIGEMLLKLVEKPAFKEISENASSFAKTHWDNSVNTLKHIDVYQKALNL
jgi:glycosyltransferase involved in cell wall biosynthesis